MSLYELALVLHSSLRWVVLALALASLGRSALAWRQGRAWGPGDDRLALGFVGAADLQLTVGLVLWMGLSPFLRAGGSTSLAAAFFAWLHPLAMVVALTMMHIVRVRVRRTAPSEAHRVWLLGIGAAIGLVLLFIPWPLDLPWARPAWRLG